MNEKYAIKSGGTELLDKFGPLWKQRKRPVIRKHIVITIVIFFLLILSSCSSKGLNAPENSILTLKPYWHHGTWVFDDQRVNLVKEPFVAGIPEMIDYITKDIPNARKGFRLLFSANEFPGYQLQLKWVRAGNGGNWYYSEKLKKEGWLCPALFKYYKDAPSELFAKAEAINE